MDYLFPPRCPVCGKVIIPKGELICDGCKDIFRVVQEPRCMKCGKMIEQADQQYCYDCKKTNQEYVQGFALWVYDKNVRESITYFKYNNRREYAKYYIAELCKYYGDIIYKKNPDVLIPVPLHREKLRKRGYNQADLIADGLSSYTHIPMDNQCLIRVKKTVAQKSLNMNQRTNNIKDAFHVHNNYSFSTYQRVMLIDDIYTTGSTINACSKVLKDAGVNEVYFLCLSIGNGF